MNLTKDQIRGIICHIESLSSRCLLKSLAREVYHVARPGFIRGLNFNALSGVVVIGPVITNAVSFIDGSDGLVFTLACMSSDTSRFNPGEFTVLERCVDGDLIGDLTFGRVYDRDVSCPKGWFRFHMVKLVSEEMVQELDKTLLGLRGRFSGLLTEEPSS